MAINDRDSPRPKIQKLVRWLVIGITSPKNRKVGSFSTKMDSCFLIETKFISKLLYIWLVENWCQDIPRLRRFIILENSSFLIIKNQELWISKIQKWTAKVSGISNCLSFIFPQNRFPQIFPGCSLFVLIFFQVLWFNKMKKCGVPWPAKPRIH